MEEIKPIYLTTLIPEFPNIYSYNNQVFKRKLDVIYNENTGVVVVPVNTTGRIKGSTGEFVTCITDNLVVKKQWTNLYQNTTTVDQDYYNTYIGGDVSTRDASSWENPSYKYVDVVSPYYKIRNDISYAFRTSRLGQEFQIIFDLSTNSGDYSILYNLSGVINVTYSDAHYAWIKLIAVAYDASMGTTWAIKQSGGNISIF